MVVNHIVLFYPEIDLYITEVTPFMSGLSSLMTFCKLMVHFTGSGVLHCPVQFLVSTNISVTVSCDDISAWSYF
jgi:hypothetical protein